MISNLEPVSKPTERISTRTKLIFLIMLVLVMSSGSVIYTDTPLFYYGVLGVGVLIIIIIVFTMYNIFQGKPILFSRDSDSNEDYNSDSNQSAGLQRVLEAERRYKNKRKRSEKRQKLKAKKKLKEKTKSNDIENGKIRQARKRKRGKKFGSVPIEESIYKEKYQIQKKDNDKKVVKGKKITTFLCPSCGSKELYYEAGLISGYKYHCKDCDYIGSFVIEKDFKI